MMNSDYVIDVSEADFEYEVLQYSTQIPVVVDFWATWCGPCRVLSPLLERLAEEANGAFRLAKVDVDTNPNLARRFGVRSIPTVKAFDKGQLVAEFTGNQAELQVRAFLEKLVPNPAGLALEKASSFLADHRWAEAENIFREVLDASPEQPAALLGLAKSLLGQGQPTEAQFILRDFPASREYTQAQTLRPLAEAFAALNRGDLEVIEGDPLGPAYIAAVRFATRGKLLLALDGLLDILRQNKRYGSGQARLVFLAILELLGEQDPQTREYRAELAAVLF